MADPGRQLAEAAEPIALSAYDEADRRFRMSLLELLDDAAAIQADLVTIRRALHREPELGLELPLTQKKVLAELEDLDVEVTLGKSLTSIVAVLTGDRPGPTVLLRGDMDGLPVIEETGLDFASTTGTMHACGHDLHTTMLIGAARLLSARRSELAGKVVFMFQPGEEGHFGARRMIEEDLLDVTGELPIGAYGLHVTGGMVPGGIFATRPGPLLAGSAELDVTVHGQGGHASSPDKSKDPIPVACEMVTALQTAVTRQFSIFDPIVVTVGQFHAGTARNIIPSEATFGATIRTFSEAAHDLAKQRIPQLLQGIAAAHDLTVDVDYRTGYPVTATNPDHVEFARQAVADLFGAERFHLMDDPIGGSEDFSYVLNEIPGAFLFLGACPPDRDHETAPSNHSAEALFDEGVLSDGAALLAELAIRRLATAP